MNKNKTDRTVKERLLSVLKDKKGDLLNVEVYVKILIAVIIGATLFWLCWYFINDIILPRSAEYWNDYADYASSFLTRP